MGRKGKAAKKDAKKGKGKKQEEPKKGKEKEKEKKDDGDDGDEEVTQEGLMGDQSWAKTNAEDFSAGMDDLFSNMLAGVEEDKKAAEAAGVDMDAKISGLGDDAAAAEAEEAEAEAKRKAEEEQKAKEEAEKKAKREARKALLASLSQADKDAQRAWKPTLRQADKAKEEGTLADPAAYDEALVLFKAADEGEDGLSGNGEFARALEMLKKAQGQDPDPEPEPKPEPEPEPEPETEETDTETQSEPKPATESGAGVDAPDTPEDAPAAPKDAAETDLNDAQAVVAQKAHSQQAAADAAKARRAAKKAAKANEHHAGKLAELADISEPRHVDLATLSRQRRKAGDGVIVRVRIRGWTKDDEPTPMAASELLEEMKGKDAGIGEGLTVGWLGLVSENQRLNESARVFQKMRRGVLGVRKAKVARDAAEKKAAEEAARIAAEEEAHRIAAEEEAARIAAEEEEARIAAEEEAARLAEAERLAATTLQCLVRRNDALSEFEAMKRRWNGMRINAATLIQRAHRRQVQYWKFQYMREASKSCQKFVRAKLAKQRYARVVEGAALLVAHSRGVLGRVAYAKTLVAQQQLKYDNAAKIQRFTRGKLARTAHQRTVAAAALINRVGRGTIARGIAADIREQRRLEKQLIMERYADLLEAGGSTECQDALNDPEFGVAHETHRDPDITAARDELKARLTTVRKAENEAQILRKVVNDGQATMSMIEAALERSPKKYASVLPVVRDLRDTLERTLALRRTELSQWRRKLSELVTERCGLAEAEAALRDASAITPEVLAMVQPQMEALEQWTELAAAEAVVMLKQLYADSPASIHTDTDRIFSAVEDLEDARDGEVFSCVVQLQLRAEEVQSQRQELELIRQRMIKLTGDGKTAGTLEDVESVLDEELRAPAEWRQELSRERSRLRAYYIRASQEVAESLVQLIERNDPEDLVLVEEALSACKHYKHSLVKTAWRQLSEHYAHLVSLRKASTLQSEYRRESQKRAAAEARYAQARSEREQLEAQLKALQQGIEVSFASTAQSVNALGAGYGSKSGIGTSSLSRVAAHRSREQHSPRRSGPGSAHVPRTEVCLICGKTFLVEKYESHAERCVVRLTKFIQENGGRLPDVVEALPGAALKASKGRPERGNVATGGADRGEQSSLLQTDNSPSGKAAAGGRASGGREVVGRPSAHHSPTRIRALSPVRHFDSEGVKNDDGDSSLFGEGFASGIGSPKSPGQSDWDDTSYHHSATLTGRSKGSNEHPSGGGGASGGGGRWSRHGVAGRWSARRPDASG